MPQRANDFFTRGQNRFPQAWTPLLVYHGTTNARVRQARYLREQLDQEIHSGSAGTVDGFWRREMFSFGFINSLRSSLDSFAHELIFFYEGSPNSTIYPQCSSCGHQRSQASERDFQFYNLLDPSKVVYASHMPQGLRDHIHQFINTPDNPPIANLRYLNKLRNAMQHRHFTLTQSMTGTIHQTLPDDPAVAPGAETYNHNRDLLGTFSQLHTTVQDFLFQAYDLAQ